MAGQPRPGLGDGVVVEVLAVGHGNLVPAQLAQDVVGQLVDGLRNRKICNFLLHLLQLIQSDGGSNLSGAASLLVPQDGKPLVPILDVCRHHLQFQAVVQSLQNLLLGIAEIGHFI